MKHLITAVVAASLLGAFGAGQMLSQDDPLPTKLGFVDMGRVFDKAARRQKMEDLLNGETDKLEQHFRERREKITEERDALELLNADSEEYQQKQRELAAKLYLLEFDSKDAGKRLKEKARQAKARLYREINAEIALYGEQNGYAGIWLNVPVTEELDRRDDIDLVTSTRSALWHAERLDLTDTIIEILNK